jgi:hypothetical protein
MPHGTCRTLSWLLVLGGLLWTADAQRVPPATGAPAPAQPASTAAPTVSNEPKIWPAPALPPTTRGQTVTITGENLPAQGVKVFLRTGKEAKGDNGRPLDAVVAADKKSLSFKLPKDNDFATGRYLVFVAFDSKELPVPGDLTVAPDETAKVRVDSIYPSTDYSSAQDNGYDFEISGENLAPVPNDNVIEVVGQGPLAAGSAEECDEYARSKMYRKICLSYYPGMETRKLQVRGFHPASAEGPVDFRLYVNGSTSETKRVIFSSVSKVELRIMVTFFPLLVMVLIAAVVLRLIRKGISLRQVSRESHSLAAAFFLDKETNTYSSAKFQLMAWIAVTFFAYLYVFFAGQSFMGI